MPNLKSSIEHKITKSLHKKEKTGNVVLTRMTKNVKLNMNKRT